MADGPEQRTNQPSGPPFWLGVLTGLVSPVLLGVLASLLGDASGVAPLLGIGAEIALLVHPRTRRFGLGALLGVGILLIVVAGACIALVAMITGQLG